MLAVSLDNRMRKAKAFAVRVVEISEGGATVTTPSGIADGQPMFAVIS